MFYQDKPKPSTAFVAAMLAALGLLFTLLLLAVALNPAERNVNLALIAAVLVLLILGAIFHAAFKTRYLLKNGYFVAMSGFIIRTVIKINDIQSVTAVKAPARLLGWNFGKAMGFCNRFRDCLLVVSSRRKIYISPSDREEFRPAVENAKK